MPSPPHLAVRANEVNRPAGKALERFCLLLGERLRSEPQPCFLTPELIAEEFRSHFGLYPPVMKGLGQLLSDLDIDWTSSEPIYESQPACYVYDHNQKQWQIRIRSDAGSMDSIHCLHELYELLWWRCYYLIPEWQAWADISNMKHPHDTADAFARDMVLQKAIFGGAAQGKGYNPIILAAIYQTAPGVCFQCFMQLRFHVPYIQARLDFDSMPDQRFMFFDDDTVTAKFYSKGTKFRDNHSRRRWASMWYLHDHLPRNHSFVAVESWISETVRHGGSIGRETNSLLGITLSEPVFAVIRSRNRRAFLQVVSVSQKEMLMDDALIAQQETIEARA